MFEKFYHSALSAVVAGLVAYAVVYVTDNDSKTDEAGTLKVKSLEIAETLTLKSPENGEDMVVLRNDGLIFSKNKIASEHFLGKQFSGQILVGNRVMVSPNDLVNSHPESWQFLAELGGNLETGGELFVRSAHGGNAVGKGVSGGQFIKIGFDKNDLLQFFAVNNTNKEVQVLALQQPKTDNAASEPLAERSTVAPPVANRPEKTEPNVGTNPMR